MVDVKNWKNHLFSNRIKLNKLSWIVSTLLVLKAGAALSLRITYIFRFWSATSSFGSLTTFNRTKVETLPTLLVASHMYLPPSNSCRFEITRLQVPPFLLTLYLLSSSVKISKESRSHLTVGDGSPFTLKQAKKVRLQVNLVSDIAL